MRLTEFLLARIAEDEEVAQGVANGTGEVARPGFSSMRVLAIGEVKYAYLLIDPDRVLAECKAKRLEVALHDAGPVGGYCAYEDGRNPIPCPTLRHLALPYADHPGYRDEWRP